MAKKMIGKKEARAALKKTDQLVEDVLNKMRSCDLVTPASLQERVRDISHEAGQGLYKYDRETQQFDDGDQTPILSQDQNCELKLLWATKMDWNPNVSYISPLAKSLMIGDYRMMMGILSNYDSNTLTKMIEKRETFLKVSALFHVVHGAKRVRGVRCQHMDCFLKLLELGANIKARDVIGANIVFHCVMSDGTEETHKMARILLEKGLDVNGVNRLGETAIGIPIMNGDYVAIQLLLDHGLDVTIKDHNGCSPMTMSMCDPKVKKMFAEAAKKKAKAMKAARTPAGCESGDFREPCEVCSQDGSKKCTGCFFARYCGDVCQKKHWDDHKTICNQIRMEYKEITLEFPEASEIVSKNVVNDNIKVHNTAKSSNKKLFSVLKVQKTFDELINKSLGKNDKFSASLTVSSQKEDIYGFLTPSCPEYRTLLDMIDREGLMGYKVYLGSYSHNNKLMVNTARRREHKSW